MDTELSTATTSDGVLVLQGVGDLRPRLRRLMALGPRCPDCAGPLAFGEGCSLCPVCGYSACGGRT